MEKILPSCRPENFPGSNLEHKDIQQLYRNLEEFYSFDIRVDATLNSYINLIKTWNTALRSYYYFAFVFQEKLTLHECAQYPTQTGENTVLHEIENFLTQCMHKIDAMHLSNIVKSDQLLEDEVLKLSQDIPSLILDEYGAKEFLTQFEYRELSDILEEFLDFLVARNREKLRLIYFSN